MASVQPERRTWLSSPLLTAVLVVAVLFSVLALIPRISAFNLPGIQQGYEPEQPIHFSHRLHAGEMNVSCLYCHSAAEKGRHAGIPAANVCMNCHRTVTAPLGAIRAEEELAQQEKREPRKIVSAEIQKIYDALALNKDLKFDGSRESKPIAWNKVHNNPDFVYFDHRAHVSAGVTCQSCHGPVETMERVRQVNDLTMGWCVNCHRDANAKGIEGKKVKASLDCASCHY